MSPFPALDRDGRAVEPGARVRVLVRSARLIGREGTVAHRLPGGTRYRQTVAVRFPDQARLSTIQSHNLLLLEPR